MANKKISEFLEALSLVDNAFIPIIQGNPLDDYKISKDNFIQSLSDDNKIDINGLNGSIDKLHFGVNTSTPIAYDLYQNITEETLSIKLPDGGSLEIGKEMFEIYINIDTVNLVAGEIPKQKFDEKSNRYNSYWIYNGVDRKNDNLGYTLENCVPCCKICNYAKQGLTNIEFIEHITKIYKHYEQDSLGSHTEYTK